jgi:hypothetical protein
LALAVPLSGFYEDTPMNITAGGLDDPRVQTLLAHHFHTARAETAPGSAHVLDLSGLKKIPSYSTEKTRNGKNS